MPDSRREGGVGLGLDSLVLVVDEGFDEAEVWPFSRTGLVASFVENMRVSRFVIEGFSRRFCLGC